MSGTVPGEITVTRDESHRNGDLRLEYIGADVILPSGDRVRAGEAITVSEPRFAPRLNWQVKYWPFDDAHDPIAHPDAFAETLRTPPIKASSSDHLDVLTSGPIAAGLPRSNVAMVGETTAEFQTALILTTISDDGLRVWLDGQLVIDHWSVHESALDRTEIGRGRHQIRVEYFQATGWAELALLFKERS